MTKIVMTGNGLQYSRMEGVLIPGEGETVDLPESAAEVLVEKGYAEYPETKKTRRGRPAKAEGSEPAAGDGEDSGESDATPEGSE